MTDVPEHLLQRSRERRAALGLGGGDSGGDAPAPPSGEAPAAAAPAEQAPAKAAPAAAPAAAAPPPPPPPPPPYVTAAETRPKLPVWAVPVLAFLPVWGIIYGFGLTEPAEELDPVLARGQEVYSVCAGCHGAAGQGGSGRPLVDVELTFPDWRDHAAWVREGSELVGAGNPYGDPDRPGGQQISQDGWPPMPGFPNLSDEDLIAVVRYEREVLGGEEEPELAEEGAMEEALRSDVAAGGTHTPGSGGGGGGAGQDPEGEGGDSPVARAEAEGGETMEGSEEADTQAGNDDGGNDTGTRTEGGGSTGGDSGSTGEGGSSGDGGPASGGR